MTKYNRWKKEFWFSLQDSCGKAASITKTLQQYWLEYKQNWKTVYNEKTYAGSGYYVQG